MTCSTGRIGSSIELGADPRLQCFQGHDGMYQQSRSCGGLRNVRDRGHGLRGKCCLARPQGTLVARSVSWRVRVEGRSRLCPIGLPSGTSMFFGSAGRLKGGGGYGRLVGRVGSGGRSRLALRVASFRCCVCKGCGRWNDVAAGFQREVDREIPGWIADDHPSAVRVTSPRVSRSCRISPRRSLLIRSWLRRWCRVTGTV